MKIFDAYYGGELQLSEGEGEREKEGGSERGGEETAGDENGMTN